MTRRDVFDLKQELIDRLTTYVKVDTQSNYESTTVPTTEGQWTLARLLVEELKTIGMEEVTVDDNGYVMATLSANTDADIPTIGFLAHLDTATDFTGTNVRPQLVEAYDGNPITLSEVPSVILSPTDFPALHNYVGHTLMTTDGTTLLGADNKAGIAEIMTAMHHLITHPEIKHGRIRVAFTPDEEIGRGPHHFNVEAFDATYAYTVDGGPLGELEYEVLMRRLLKSSSMERMFIREQQKIRWSIHRSTRWRFTIVFLEKSLLNSRMVSKGSSI